MMGGDGDETRIVQVLCDLMGYGRVMQLASSLWNKHGGVKGGHHVVGPCARFVVRCPHTRTLCLTETCDYCAGCGWVTEKVFEMMTDEEKQ